MLVGVLPRRSIDRPILEPARSRSTSAIDQPAELTGAQRAAVDQQPKNLALYAADAFPVGPTQLRNASLFWWARARASAPAFGLVSVPIPFIRLIS